MKKQIKNIVNIIWKYNKWWGIVKIVNAILFAVLTPLNTICLQKVLDDIIDILNNVKFTKDIFFDFGLMITVLFAEIFITHFDSYVEVRFDMCMTSCLEKKIIDKYKKIDYSCFERGLTYDIISRISKNPSETIKSIYWKFVEIFKIFLTLVGFLLIYSRVSYWLIGVFLVFLIPMLFENYKAGSLWYDLYERQTTDERKIAYYEKLLTTKTSLLELKIYQATDYIKNLWSKKSLEMLTEKNKTLNKVTNTLLTKSLFAVLWYICSTGLLLYNRIKGHISVGMFLALFNTTLHITDTITGLLEVFGNFSKEIKETSYINSFFELKEREEKTESIKLPVKRILFENVYFSYPGSKTEVLQDLNFELDLNMSTAIVGENGSGKTTIIKLLCGFYRPTKGRILFDDRDISEFDTSEIGKVVKTVFQDFFQYELTIRENVAFGNLVEMDHDEKIGKALDMVNLQKLKEIGIDTNLGKLNEGGIDLSKGQWQRLAVSRIFLDSDTYAILDEPTASMDPLAEYQMYQLFYNLMKSRGSLMISHRLASAKMSDNIIVLKKGHVVERGNHEELMNREGEYYKLFHKQAQWYQ